LLSKAALVVQKKRGDNGYRYYSSETIQQVQFIKKGQSLGFSLGDMQRILNVRDYGETSCNLMQDLLDRKIAQLEAQIKQMMMFKLELEGYRDLRAKVPNFKQDDREICPLIATVPLKANVDSIIIVSSS